MGERIDTAGLAAALELLGASGGLQDGAGATVDMFEAEDAPLPLPVKGASGPKGGRPKGARNRSTDAWVGFYLSQHRAPLSVLGNIASQDVGELHALLQGMADQHTRRKYRDNGDVEEVRVLVDPLAVLKLIRDTAAVAAKYIHKEQPKAIELEQRQRGVVILAEAMADDVDDLEALPMPVPQAVPQIVQNQHVAETTGNQSDSDQVGHAESASDNSPLLFRDS
jgi:hypothetical protein